VGSSRLSMALMEPMVVVCCHGFLCLACLRAVVSCQSWDHHTSLSCATARKEMCLQWGCPQDSSSALCQRIVASKSFTGTIWKNSIVPDCLAYFVVFLFLFFFNAFAANRGSLRQLSCEHAAREGHGCIWRMLPGLPGFPAVLLWGF